MNKYKKFMLESNRIDGEDRINPGDMNAIEFILAGDIHTARDILTTHKILGKYLNRHWVGRFKKYNVIVGDYFPPQFNLVSHLMSKYILVE